MKSFLFVVALVLALPVVAFAQAAGAPTDASALPIPYLAQIVGVIVAVFALVSAIVPDSKMPKIISQIVNFLALNFGRARNDPNAQ